MVLKKKIMIKKFIKGIDKNITVKFQKGALECEPENGIVYIGEENVGNELFQEFVQELNPNCLYNPFLMGILHEVRAYNDI